MWSWCQSDQKEPTSQWIIVAIPLLSEQCKVH
jgi:hypothetical protein